MQLVLGNHFSVLSTESGFGGQQALITDRGWTFPQVFERLEFWGESSKECKSSVRVRVCGWVVRRRNGSGKSDERKWKNGRINRSLGIFFSNSEIKPQFIYNKSIINKCSVEADIQK